MGVWELQLFIAGVWGNDTIHISDDFHLCARVIHWKPSAVRVVKVNSKMGLNRMKTVTEPSSRDSSGVGGMTITSSARHSIL